MTQPPTSPIPLAAQSGLFLHLFSLMYVLGVDDVDDAANHVHNSLILFILTRTFHLFIHENGLRLTMANGPDKIDMIYDLVKETRDDVKQNTKDISKIDTKLAVHKTKSGLLGTAGGAGVLGLKELFEYFRAMIGGS